MCENIHAVPVSSYFMFVILVLLTLGLIQHGESQLSFPEHWEGILGLWGCSGVGESNIPWGMCVSQGMEGDQEPVGWEGWWDTQSTLGASPGCPKDTAPLRAGVWTWPERAGPTIPEESPGDASKGCIHSK